MITFLLLKDYKDDALIQRASNNKKQNKKMANKNVQAPESESLNIHEAFFLKNKKLILGAIVAIIVIIAGIFVYNNQIAGPRED